MQTVSFVGERKPLDTFDIPRLAHRIDVSEDHLRAFLEVEARSRGYDRQGRPIMLFEPHVFYRNLPQSQRAEAIRAGLAYPRWDTKPYPRDSYPRLIQAIAINEDAALKACSIGLSQVLVENHSSVGYRTPQDMWQAFMDDEEEHVEAMVRFILANNIADDLKAELWETVARTYNGPGYKKNRYHTKMAEAFAKFKRLSDVDWAPDVADHKTAAIPDPEVVRNVQNRLRDRGYPEVGKADGTWGTKTRAAVLGFRADHDLPIVAQIDQELLAALMLAPQRAVAPERAQATAADIRATGSRQIAAADKTEGVGWLVGGGGGLFAATEALDGIKGQIGQLEGLLDRVDPLMETVMSLSPYLLLAVGAYVVWQQWSIKKARVQDHREAKHVGR